MASSSRHLLVALLLATVSACAPRAGIVLPQGPEAPLEAALFDEILRQREAACAEVTAITADLRVSGRVEGERVRGTLQIGVDRDGLRIEAVPPFGAPIFVLAGRTRAATLLLPREQAYVEAAVPELTEAVMGVALEPDDLLAVLTGCGVPFTAVVTGRAVGPHWVRLDGASGARLWLRQTGRDRQLVVADAGPWRVEYTSGVGQPLRGVLHHAVARTQLSFTVQDPELLDALPDAAYAVHVDAAARRVPLDRLRAQRALRDP